MVTKKKIGITIFLSDKTVFKLKVVKRDKEGYHITIKVLLHQEVITIVSIYALNIEAPKYIKQKITELKGEISSNTRIVGGFYIPLSTINRSSTQRISKETADLNTI